MIRNIFVIFFFTLSNLVPLLWAKELSGVFSGLTISPTNENGANTLFAATLTFSISPTMDASLGDYFSLEMPCVNKIWGSNSGNTILIEDSQGNKVANCVAQLGDYLGPTKLVCTVVSTQIQAAVGQLTFEFAWNLGYTASDYSQMCASTFVVGSNTITWDGMQTTVTLATVSGWDGSHLLTSGAATYNYTNKIYYLGGTCSSSFSESMSVSFEGNPQGSVPLTSCDDVSVYISNSFNAWWLPTSVEPLPTGSSVSCDGVTVSVSASNIPAGYHIIVLGQQHIGDSYSSVTLTDTIIENLTCDSQLVPYSTIKSIGWIVGSATGTATVSYLPTVTNTEYTYWTGTYTTTYLTETTYSIGTDNVATPDIIYHVETPGPKRTTSTTTTGWTGSYTTTYSTETTETVGTDGSTTPEIIYHVETPSTVLTSTTTTGWTGSYTTTYSTETTETVGTDGSTTPEIIYHVETPSSGIVSTTYTPWTGTFVSTFSTETTQTVGTDGSTTPETIYHVETPTTLIVSTTTTGWTGTYTTTYSTETTETVGTDGSTTPEIIYHVETPSTGIVSTTYTPWTGTFISTFSTETTETVGTDGSTTPETIYHVETPTTLIVSTTTTGWTGTYTTTYSTETTETVGTDGSTTPEIIYHVETPSSGIVSTTYTPWTGTFVSTFSTETTQTVGTDGSTTPETIYHVETPLSFYYGNSSSTVIRKESSSFYEPPVTLSTVTVTSNGVITDYTTTCPESHGTDSSTHVVVSTTSSELTVSGPSDLFVPSKSSEIIISASVPGPTSSTMLSKITGTESSPGVITSKIPISDYATTTTLVPMTPSSEITCESCIETISTTNVVSSTPSANSYDQPKSPSKTELDSAESSESSTVPAETMTSTVTGETDIQSKAIPTTSLAIYPATSTASVSSIIIGSYSGVAARMVYNYVTALLAVLPLAFI